MMRALYSGTTGMRGQQLQLDTISNNLANANTAGFKKSRVQFEDLYYQEMRAVGAENIDGGQVPSGIQVGLGVLATSNQKVFTQGSIQESGNDLDMAIEGRGFFQIIRDGEEFYTRAGAFTRDADGFIVTQNGDRLQPEFQIPADTVTVSVDARGVIQTKDAQQNVTGEAQLTLHNFINPSGLRAEGGNLFRPTLASGDPVESNPGVDGTGVVLQRFIEVSNVDVTEEMVNLIITQRAFEMNSKSVQTADQLLEVANTLKR
mgnify:CR=1 FL=1